MKATTQGVTAKLFLGMLLTPDIKNALAHNHDWQAGAFLGSEEGRKLIVVHYQNREYLGVHIDHSITLNELKIHLLFCIDQYKHYFPALSSESFKPTIFSQIFIS